jgi:hypothetical protein
MTEPRQNRERAGRAISRKSLIAAVTRLISLNFARETTAFDRIGRRPRGPVRDFYGSVSAATPELSPNQFGFGTTKKTVSIGDGGRDVDRWTNLDVACTSQSCSRSDSIPFSKNESESHKRARMNP